MIAICDYAAGNLRSLQSALARVGLESLVTNDPVQIAEAAQVVFPGVGSAGAAMRELGQRGIDAALRERSRKGLPTLGICLGMQLAAEWSEEDGGTKCLGLVPGRVVPLRGGPVPRVGWARVEPWGGDYYFAHSFALESDCVTALSEGIAAGIELDGFTGVQFHPEKSGPAGEAFLRKCLIPA